MCGSCGVKLVNKKDLPAGVMGIALDGVMNDNFPSLLSWAWCVNENKVKAAFKSNTGMDISDADFVNLAKVHKLGNDVKGYKVNFLDLLNSIIFTQAERNNASCPYNFTR